MKYKELEAAAEFGVMPHEFISAPKWSQVRAIAFVEAKGLVETYLIDE